MANKIMVQPRPLELKEHSEAHVTVCKGRMAGWSSERGRGGGLWDQGMRACSLENGTRCTKYSQEGPQVARMLPGTRSWEGNSICEGLTAVRHVAGEQLGPGLVSGQ